MQIVSKIKKLGWKLGIKKLLGYEAIFSCAFCVREQGRELYREQCHREKHFAVLSHTKQYWYADPLMWEKDGKEVVFLERMDRETGIGCIACADITGGMWQTPQPVIRENFHMSFPMCFEWDGELYMIPETEMNESVNLYRCVKFPYQWEKTGEFLKGQRLVDSIVWEREGNKIRFLASEYKQGDDFYTRYCAYELQKKESGISAEDLGVITDDYTLQSRMAGPAVNSEQKLVPVQRSTSGIYGYSVQFREKEKALPGKTVKELLPSDFRNMGYKLVGVHTYSQSSHYEMLDIQYLVYNKNKWKKKIGKFLEK